MSLNTVLQTVMRAKVPENVLAQCKAADRNVVENILIVAQETIPTVNITQASLVHERGTYHITLPSVHPHDRVKLRELVNIQAYSPARIEDIHVLQKNDVLTLHIIILDETTPITTSQLDIVRLCKRTRRS